MNIVVPISTLIAFGCVSGILSAQEHGAEAPAHVVNTLVNEKSKHSHDTQCRVSAGAAGRAAALAFDCNPKGVLCLTFDDRHWERWTAAMPIFEKYGARASFFPNGQLDANALTYLKKIYDAGHTIGVHTMRHLNAPDAVAAIGFDAYWKQEIAPQMAALSSAGIVSSSLAYPNNRRSDEIDEALAARGINRLRAGLVGVRPYDPEGKKRLSLVPFPKLDALYLDAETVRTNRLMRGVGIGTAYGTDIDDLCAGLRRAASRGETVVFFSHDIAAQPNSISMRIEWLEKILATAREEGMSVLGFDDLPRLGR
jgi:hypothetical protein